MKHSEWWIWHLAVACGHRGFVTLAEIRNAEREGWQPAATHDNSQESRTPVR